MTSLYFSNRPSNINRDLIQYMQTNLKAMCRMGIRINFVVVSPDQAEMYTQKNIVNFPTLVHGQSRYVGLDKIKGFFGACNQNFKKSRSVRTTDDDITDYWSGIIAEGDEECDNEADEIKSQAQQAIQDRQTKLSSQGPSRKTPTGPAPNRSAPNKPSTPAPSRKAPTQGSAAPRNSNGSRTANIEPSAVEVLKSMNDPADDGGMDDKLMAKFFENQIETDM